MSSVASAEVLEIPAAVAEALGQRYPKSVDELRLIEQQVQRVAEHTKSATVGVMVGQGVGSGVIVSAEGLVLTAGHVVGRAKRRATVLLPDGRRLVGRTLGANHLIDAGLVKLENPPTDLPYLPIAKVLPKIGEWVIAIGQPGGMLNNRSPPVRLGRVLVSEDEWVCTDCTLVGGDSGGPLLNLRGEVLAVHSSIGPAIVHNFHIPVVEIKKDWQRLLAGQVWGKAVEELVSTTMRPLIGIAGRTENQQCLITQVFPDLPADEAGVRAGDVVLSVDGAEVTSFREVSRKVLKKRPGQKMRLQLQREDRVWEVEVVLAGVRIPTPKGDLPDAESEDEP